MTYARSVPSSEASITLAGLMSRWSRPASCASSSAAATWPRDRERLARLERPAAADDRGQVGALEVAHREPEVPVLLAGAVDLGDVRVLHALGVLRLAQEALADLLVVREVGREDLQRGAAVLPVLLLGEPDNAHSALAELGLQAEPADESPMLKLGAGSATRPFIHVPGTYATGSAPAVTPDRVSRTRQPPADRSAGRFGGGFGRGFVGLPRLGVGREWVRASKLSATITMRPLSGIFSSSLPSG